jgi:hypothetical protein
MRPRDLFSVAMRVIGVWFWTQAAYWGYWGLLKAEGTGLGNANISARDDGAYAILYALLGIALVAGARGITWIAYGDEPDKK